MSAPAVTEGRNGAKQSEAEPKRKRKGKERERGEFPSTPTNTHHTTTLHTIPHNHIISSHTHSHTMEAGRKTEYDHIWTDGKIAQFIFHLHTRPLTRSLIHQPLPHFSSSCCCCRCCWSLSNFFFFFFFSFVCLFVRCSSICPGCANADTGWSRWDEWD